MFFETMTKSFIEYKVAFSELEGSHAGVVGGNMRKIRSLGNKIWQK